MTPDQVFKRWVHGAIVVFVVAFVYFIVADIWLPLSAQARVMHPVVGIAPEVSGQVTQVLVQNNQVVAVLGLASNVAEEHANAFIDWQKS